MLALNAGSLEGVEDAVKGIVAMQRPTQFLVLDKTGEETIKFLRSLTSERRPPIRKGGPSRPAHPGHWADRSGDLARAYDYVVLPTTLGYQLILTNDMEYAEDLEGMSGFFVLSGAIDENGPVEKSMRLVMADISPDWIFQSWDVSSA
jgi:hypothetical protein